MPALARLPELHGNDQSHIFAAQAPVLAQAASAMHAIATGERRAPRNDLGA